MTKPVYQTRDLYSQVFWSNKTREEKKHSSIIITHVVVVRKVGKGWGGIFMKTWGGGGGAICAERKTNFGGLTVWVGSGKKRT